MLRRPNVAPAPSSPAASPIGNRLMTSGGVPKRLQQPARQGRRGPWAWYDWLTCYLPSHNGPYAVGTLTLELPLPESLSKRELASTLKLKNHEPALKLSNSLMTIFYPTPEPSTSSPRLRWITFPQILGYLKFANIRSWKWFLAIPLSLIAIGGTKLPVSGAAPIAQKSRKLPLIMFCHGLTGNRTCYSQLCGQLAARGYVVAAVEHRDRSGSHSVVNYRSDSGIRSSAVAYIDMSDLSDETRPDNYLVARAYQLELRVLELLAATKILAALSEPEGWKTIKSANLRKSGSADWFGDDGSTWHEDEWKRFASAVDWNENVIASGHSFGAATVLALARLTERPHNWAKLILYDPWLETFDHWPKAAPPLGKEPDLPILVLNSPGFSHWPSHFDSLLRAVEGCPKSWILTIGGIIHSSFSDLPILFERLLKYMGRLRVDSWKALDLIIRASIEFIEDQPHDVLDLEGVVQEPQIPEELEPGVVVAHLKPQATQFKT